MSHHGSPPPRLAALARYGLPGTEAIAWTLDEHEGRDLVAAAEANRLLGPFLLAVECGQVAMPEVIEALLRDRHEAAMWWCLRVERRLLDIRALFERAGGVNHLVVKGPAIAHLDEGDPSLRSFADLDLLVRPSDLDRAVVALEADGGERPWAERRPGFDHRFAKSVTLRGTDDIEIDLHRSLCDGAHGFRIPLDDLFVSQVTFRFAEEEIATLSPVHRCLHGAYHAVLGSPAPKLMSLRDLAGYLTRDDLPVEDVTDEVRRWRGDAVLAAAVAETIATLALDIPLWQRWLDNVQLDQREVAIVDRQRREGSTPGRAKLDGLAELSIRDKAAYLLALTVPSREHLRSRTLTLGAIYRRRYQPGRAGS